SPPSSDLLDLSVPSAPTVIDAGVYAFNLSVISGNEATADLLFPVSFDVDGNGFDFSNDGYATFDAATQGTNHGQYSLCVVGYCAAGVGVQCRVQTASGDRSFRVQGTVQRIT